MTSTSSKWLLSAAAAVLSIAVCNTRPGLAQDTDNTPRTVTVSATGKVVAEPDIAYISAGVIADAATAKEAISRNSATMSKLITGLKEAGIAAKDIQTATFSVEPRYAQAKDGTPSSISGYRVTNLIRLSVREVKRLGELLDQAIALGANRIEQIAFDVANPERLLDEARRKAMDNARLRGELYAKAAGAQLGLALRITEGSIDHGPMPTGRAAAFKAVPIEAGSTSIEVDVTVVYALR
jgi:hypothetical protein